VLASEVRVRLVKITQIAQVNRSDDAATVNSSTPTRGPATSTTGKAAAVQSSPTLRADSVSLASGVAGDSKTAAGSSTAEAANFTLTATHRASVAAAVRDRTFFAGMVMALELDDRNCFFQVLRCLIMQPFIWKLTYDLVC